MIEVRDGGRGGRARLVRVLCRLFVKPTLRWWPLSGPLIWLAPLVDLSLRPLRRASDTRWERVRTPRVLGELVTPVGVGEAAPGAAIVYLHGGAFVFCGLATHRRVVEDLARRTGLPVLAVRYRHLPRFTIRDALDDVLGALEWLGARGTPVERIALVGDSAGGYLSIMGALEAARTGLGRPAAVAAMSPWLNLSGLDQSAHPDARRDPFIPAQRVAELACRCTGTPVGSIVSSVWSPASLPLEGLPPVLIIAAESEVLRTDAELMERALTAAGVPVRLIIWSGMVHAFPVLAGALPESRAALREVATFIEQATEASAAIETAAVAESA